MKTSALFIVPAIWLSFQPGFNTAQLWYLSVTTVVVQMILSLFLAQRSLQKFVLA